MDQDSIEVGSQPTVLVIDDEPYIRRALRRVLERHGYRVEEAPGGEEALALVSAAPADIALVDLKMPGMSGHELLRALRRVSPSTQCIMMTAFHTPDDAFQALNAGAYDYFEKPIEDWMRFFQILRSALRVRELEREASALKRERDSLTEQLDQGEGLIGNSPAMMRLRGLIRDAARYPVPVLITGESGSGKERVARSIHERSSRSEGPFEAVNCGAFAPDLVAAELFGTVPGAYTGATEREGLFRSADGGTVLLDEVGDLPPELQVALLRVLQEGEVRPVGSDRRIPVDVRVIGATHIDLEEAVAAGRFRRDLYFRMNLMQIRVPPLRERKEDIPLLVWYFLSRFSQEFGHPIGRVHPETIGALSAQDWSDNNVRELENAVVRAAIRAGGGDLKLEHFPDLRAITPPSTPTVHAGSGAADSGGAGYGPWLLGLDYTAAKQQLIEDFSRWYLRSRLADSGWNIREAADMSGQARPNFKKLMKRYGVERPSAAALDQRLKG